MSSEWNETVYGLMPAGLKSAKLGDLCTEGGVQTGPFGSQLHQEDYVEVGTPIITVEHLGENRIVHSNLPKVSSEDCQRLSKYTLRRGDIVFSRVGSVDRRALVQPSEDGWLFSGRCLRVRPRHDVLDSEWLSYFFGLPSFKNYIRGIAVGATMPSLNTKLLSDVPIYFPPIDVQRLAAGTLSLLDNRITLLRETNATLEAIAQALFKSWFVDFDPVHANAGTQAPSLPPEIQALFPATFTDSPQGPIPEGWSVKACQEIIDVRDGTHASPKPSETGYPLVTSRHITSGELSLDGTYLISEAEFLDISKRSKVDHLDVLLTMIGTVGIPALVLSESTNFAIKNIGLFKTSKRPDFSAYIYLLLKSKEMQNYLHARMAGTTQKYLSLKALREIAIIEPTPEIIQAFSVNIRPIFEGIQNNRVQVQALTDLRDTLLPRLISGQLRLPEEEQAVAAITGYANV